MTCKTEDDIAREKEAIAAMGGAKKAMEAALARHDRLVSAIRVMNKVLTDMQEAVGEAGYMTWSRGDGNSGQGFMKFKDQIARIRKIGEDVL